MRNVSLSGLARRALLAVLALALALAKDSMAQDSGRLQPRADPAVEAAVEAARRTPVPDYAALQQSSDIKDVVQEVTGDTTALEALRQDGQGALFAPGRAEADRCHSQGDPTCLAVQVVDRTSTTRPARCGRSTRDGISGQLPAEHLNHRQALGNQNLRRAALGGEHIGNARLHDGLGVDS